MREGAALMPLLLGLCPEPRWACFACSRVARQARTQAAVEVAMGAVQHAARGSVSEAHAAGTQNDLPPLLLILTRLLPLLSALAARGAPLSCLL